MTFRLIPLSFQFSSFLEYIFSSFFFPLFSHIPFSYHRLSFSSSLNFPFSSLLFPLSPALLFLYLIFFPSKRHYLQFPSHINHPPRQSTLPCPFFSSAGPLLSLSFSLDSFSFFSFPRPKRPHPLIPSSLLSCFSPSPHHFS